MFEKKLPYSGLSNWIMCAVRGAGFVCFLVLFLSTHQAEAVKIKTTKGLYFEGAKFFQNKDYASAAERFDMVYKLLPKKKRFNKARNRLSYFRGVCYYHTKKWRKAKKQLDLFLNNNPKKDTEKDKEKIQQAVDLRDKLKAIISTLPPEKRKQPKTKVIIKEKIIKVPTKPTTSIRALPLVVLGLGVAVIAGGVVTGTMTASQETQRKKLHQEQAGTAQPESKEIAALYRSSQNLAMTTNILYIAGGAVTATGLVLVLALGLTKTNAPPPIKSTKSANKKTKSLTQSMHKWMTIEYHAVF